jgi:hypothetical protein
MLIAYPPPRGVHSDWPMMPKVPDDSPAQTELLSSTALRLAFAHDGPKSARSPAFETMGPKGYADKLRATPTNRSTRRERKRDVGQSQKGDLTGSLKGIGCRKRMLIGTAVSDHGSINAFRLQHRIDNRLEFSAVAFWALCRIHCVNDGDSKIRLLPSLIVRRPTFL